MQDQAISADVKATRKDFYAKIGKQSHAPLWEVLKGLVPEHPTSKFAPHVWKYADSRPLLLEAGKLLTAEEAERRVLVLENPTLRGQSRCTNSLFAGVQLIMPGEIAEAHKHVSSAIRLVLDGNGAYTAVDGERTTMRPGDFVITPSWTWHDHGNDSDRPMV